MIKHIKEKNIWVVETGNLAYVMGISETKLVNHVYFGEKLPYLTDYPEAENYNEWGEGFVSAEGKSQEEYMSWCGVKYLEPCLKGEFAGHVRDIDLRYSDFYIESDELTLILKDTQYPLTVKLHYKTVHDCDLIERSAEIVNEGDDPVQLETALSGALNLPRYGDYRLSYLVGKWAGETQLKQIPVPESKVVLESRRGTTSNHANPWFALDAHGAADEDMGELYFGALAYSGNWKIVIEQDNFQLTKVSAGIHDFDFKWHLKPGTAFKTPTMVFGYSNRGFSLASHNLHRYQLRHVLPKEHRSTLRKVLYNSWEATKFDVTEQGQGKLAEQAASIGIELFVVDDGWFGERNSDHAGLGDWQVNEQKFPNGLEALIEKVNGLGMDFGLWVEPEMTNPDSDLYRKHPDWVYHFKTRASTLRRNQLVLNLGRKDVQEFVFEFMNHLLSKYNIKFIKWDMNRSFSEPGLPSACPEEQKEIWVRHTQALYDIAQKLKQNHPSVIFQSCSGGGGRVDLGVLSYFDQVWPSDNTDASDRLFIQEGFSYAYCSKIMESWVTDQSNWNNWKHSLTYRFHSAMTGNLGIGGNLLQWSDKEKEVARKWINVYKEIRETVQHGLQYRLHSPRKGNLLAVMYVNEGRTEAVLFAFQLAIHSGDNPPVIRLKGLDENLSYWVEGEKFSRSGKALMLMGITVHLTRDFESALIRIHQNR